MTNSNLISTIRPVALGVFVVLAATVLSFGFVHTARADYDGFSFSYTPDYSYSYAPDNSYSYTPDYSYSYTPDSGYSYTPDYSYSYTPDSAYSYTPDYGYSYTPDTGYSYTPDSGYSYNPDSKFSYTADSGYSYTPDSSYTYVADSGYSYTPDSYYTYTPDYTYTYTPDSGYTYTPDTYTGYSGSSYSSGGYYGSSYYPSYYWRPSYSTPVYGSTGKTTVNTCVGVNNCNTNITTNTNTVSSGGGYYVSATPSYPVIIGGTVANNPYVSLASLPYTGLDLGVWGTVAYWGFLILWCLFAAYLIVVKRIQNKFVTFLFGDTAEHAEVVTAHVEHTAHEVHDSHAHAPAHAGHTELHTATKAVVDPIDSFILTQIELRTRA